MARREGGPGATPAVVAVRASGVPHRVLTYAHDPRAAAEEGWGLEAATALGVDPRRVHKTLCVLVDGSPAVAVVPVTARVDLKAIAAALGGKRAAMADPVDAQRWTGYVVGGISPVGQKRRLPTVLDESADAYDTVLVSGGRRGLDLELSPVDLLAATGGRLAPIARP